ncbi:MAG TPA: nucleoside hydrolase [Candidatus Limnocylindria bacterium]|nr:nucleoside hydrolase [Candidatus Limnocylindria bacterium]
MHHPPPPIRALIDTDPGIDDALALLLAWGTPALSVEWVTTVAGNVPLDMATRNLARLLDLRRPAPPPRVAAGAGQPLARPLVTATAYHGDDGMGDLRDWPPTAEPAGGVDAVGLMIEAAREVAGALTVIALGPLTNVALALQADAAAMGGIGRLVVMGGAVDVAGNVTPSAEFNIHVDPEAAARVLDAGLALDLVPLDATRQAVLPRADLEGCPGPLAARVAAFSARGFRVDVSRGTRELTLHDPLAVAVAVDPTLVTWEAVRLAVGPEGETRRAEGPPNCRIARTVDAPRLLSMLLRALCPAS